MSSKKLILIKIGGSAITHKNIPYKVRTESLKRIARNISKVKNIRMIIAHGSGSFGHTSASIYGGRRGYKNRMGIARVSKDAFDINKIVVDALIKEKIPAISIRPMGIITAAGGMLEKSFFSSIEKMINQNLVPVLFGDVIWDSKWKSTIFSGETILSKIAEFFINKKYNIEKVIEIGETDGIYDDKKRTIPLIDKVSWPKIKKFIEKSDRPDVTGGMIHKAETALALAENGVKTFLIGNRKNSFYSAIIGKSVKGTVIK
ncbi:MAG: isopentenyl phosphate kinase family protein [Candidatus Levybacteria bacterium]|nr:isopentenyl phosphate kinase family protein [Candidatus Levybacteria bacterium]